MKAKGKKKEKVPDWRKEWRRHQEDQCDKEDKNMEVVPKMSLPSYFAKKIIMNQFFTLPQ